MSTCPHPEKRRFRSKRRAALEAKIVGALGRREVLAARIYRCRCGTWHITSQEYQPRKGGQ